MAEKNLPFEEKIEKIWERRTEFLAMNPAGDVPVLVEQDGTTLANSQVICEYLEEVYGDWKTPPKDPKKWFWYECGNWKEVKSINSIPNQLS